MRYLMVILLILSLTLSGCWDQVELDQIALVLLLGIDTDPMGDGFEVTVHIQDISAGGGGGGTTGQGGGSEGASEYIIITGRGQTVIDALRNLRSRVQGKLSFHHVRIIMLGEDVARKGIDSVLDMLFRAPEIRLNSYLLICQGTARELMILPPETSPTLAEELRGMIGIQEEWSKGYAPTLAEFSVKYLDRSSQPVAGKVFGITPRTPLQPETGEEQAQKKTPGVVTMEGLAVFRDDKLVDWLTGTETIGYRYLTGLGGTMLLIVPWHSGLVSIELEYNYGGLEYVVGSDPPHFRYSLTASGEILEYTGSIELSNQLLDELASLAADMLRDLLINTEKRAREMDTDFLGLGSAISLQDPQRWQTLNKKWRETFPDTKTEFEVTFRLRHTGGISNPPIR